MEDYDPTMKKSLVVVFVVTVAKEWRKLAGMTDGRWIGLNIGL